MNEISRLFKIFFMISLFCSIHAKGQEQKVSAEKAFCPGSLSETLCQKYVAMLKSAMASKPQNIDEFKTALSKEAKASLNDPEMWNAVLQSPVLKERFADLPITLQFKLLDREEADSVIGLEFSYSKAFNRTTYSTSGDREHSFQFQFDIDGVVTQNAKDNPKNFINAKFALAGRSVPSFNLKKLDVAYAPGYCDEVENIDNPDCALLQAAGVQAFFEPLGSTFYLNYGVDLGYETDQRFDAKNQTFGGFLFAAYEDMRRDTFIGYNNIKPSLRVAAETVDPNMETPRALAGDNTSYTRVSGEFSLVVPLQKLANLPYYFTFNYQVYEEMDASDMVKSADLDSYQLKTYSLNTPTGVFVSYSSGRLPFGLENESTVELGFQTYF